MPIKVKDESQVIKAITGLKNLDQIYEANKAKDM
jgi:hypothetical protein